MSTTTNQLRREVLQCYKQILRTRGKIFAQDEHALKVTKEKAREEFRKNSHLNDPKEIESSIQVGRDAIEILKKTVIQGRLNERGNYEIKLQKENID